MADYIEDYSDEKYSKYPVITETHVKAYEDEPRLEVRIIFKRFVKPETYQVRLTSILDLRADSRIIQSAPMFVPDSGFLKDDLEGEYKKEVLPFKFENVRLYNLTRSVEDESEPTFIQIDYEYPFYFKGPAGKNGDTKININLDTFYGLECDTADAMLVFDIVNYGNENFRFFRYNLDGGLESKLLTSEDIYPFVTEVKKIDVDERKNTYPTYWEKRSLQDYPNEEMYRRASRLPHKIANIIRDPNNSSMFPYQGTMWWLNVKFDDFYSWYGFRNNDRINAWKTTFVCKDVMSFASIFPSNFSWIVYDQEKKPYLIKLSKDSTITLNSDENGLSSEYRWKNTFNIARFERNLGYIDLFNFTQPQFGGRVFLKIKAKNGFNNKINVSLFNFRKYDYNEPSSIAVLSALTNTLQSEGKLTEGNWNLKDIKPFCSSILKNGFNFSLNKFGYTYVELNANVLLEYLKNKGQFIKTQTSLNFYLLFELENNKAEAEFECDVVFYDRQDILQKIEAPFTRRVSNIGSADGGIKDNYSNNAIDIEYFERIDNSTKVGPLNVSEILNDGTAVVNSDFYKKCHWISKMVSAASVPLELVDYNTLTKTYNLDEGKLKTLAASRSLVWYQDVKSDENVSISFSPFKGREDKTKEENFEYITVDWNNVKAGVQIGMIHQGNRGNTEQSYSRQFIVFPSKQPNFLSFDLINDFSIAGNTTEICLMREFVYFEPTLDLVSTGVKELAQEGDGFRTVTDYRTGKTYNTVVLGKLEWLAEDFWWPSNKVGTYLEVGDPQNYHPGPNTITNDEAVNGANLSKDGSGAFKIFEHIIGKYPFYLIGWNKNFWEVSGDNSKSYYFTKGDGYSFTNELSHRHVPFLDWRIPFMQDIDNLNEIVQQKWGYRAAYGLRTDKYIDYLKLPLFNYYNTKSVNAMTFVAPNPRLESSLMKSLPEWYEQDGKRIEWPRDGGKYIDIKAYGQSGMNLYPNFNSKYDNRYGYVADYIMFTNWSWVKNVRPRLWVEICVKRLGDKNEGSPYTKTINELKKFLSDNYPDWPVDPKKDDNFQRFVRITNGAGGRGPDQFPELPSEWGYGTYIDAFIYFLADVPGANKLYPKKELFRRYYGSFDFRMVDDTIVNSGFSSVSTRDNYIGSSQSTMNIFSCALTNNTPGRLVFSQYGSTYSTYFLSVLKENTTQLINHQRTTSAYGDSYGIRLCRNIQGKTLDSKLNNSIRSIVVDIPFIGVSGWTVSNSYFSGWLNKDTPFDVRMFYTSIQNKVKDKYNNTVNKNLFVFDAETWRIERPENIQNADIEWFLTKDGSAEAQDCILTGLDILCNKTNIYSNLEIADCFYVKNEIEFKTFEKKEYPSIELKEDIDPMNPLLHWDMEDGSPTFKIDPNGFQGFKGYEQPEFSD